MHRVWKKFIRNHRGKFSAELKLKTDFPVRIGFCFARPIYFCIDINGYLITILWRQAQGNNLCAYYIMENLHMLVGPQKAYSKWQQEVSKKLFKVSTRFVIVINILTFS